MIIYKRLITQEDVSNLNDNEELIYYKTDNIAITINQHHDRYLVRKKQIYDNKLIDEVFVERIDEVLKFIEN